MYADKVTKSMHVAISETNRRRQIQGDHNRKHGIAPQGIHKAVRDITERVKGVAEERAPYKAERKLMSVDELFRVVKDLEVQMKKAAKNLEFEKAAMFRDEVLEIRRLLAMAKKDA